MCYKNVCIPSKSPSQFNTGEQFYAYLVYNDVINCYITNILQLTMILF